MQLTLSRVEIPTLELIEHFHDIDEAKNYLLVFIFFYY
jgi:hypothetical protein